MKRLAGAFLISVFFHTGVIMTGNLSQRTLPKVDITTGKTSVAVIFKQKMLEIDRPRELVKEQKTDELPEKKEEIVEEALIQEEIIQTQKIDRKKETESEEKALAESQENDHPEKSFEAREEEKHTVPSAASEGVEWIEARYRKNPPPEYPRQALVQNMEGIVTIVVFIDEDGSPYRVEVEDSSGSHLLDRAAVKAVWKWKFIPAARFGKMIKSRARIPIYFKIE